MAKSWEQILGGYATGTLTEEEKRQLFEAALDDQTLFDTLADEEALRVLLANPEARQRILDSLQATGNPQETAAPHSPRLRWYRKPSSLAWAGSMAAMGLALLFGWQMEALWGPVVQEELQAERSVSEDKDEMAIPSQPSRTEVEKGPAEVGQKELRSEPQSIASPPGRPPATKSAAMTKASKDEEQMNEAPAAVPSEQVLPQGVKKERRLKAKELVRQPPPVVMDQLAPMSQMASKEYEDMAPSVGSAGTRKEDSRQLPSAQTFDDQMRRSRAPSSTSAKEFSEAHEGSRAKGEEAMGSRAPQQIFGGMSSKKERELQEEALFLKKSQETARGATVGSPRGLRYSFIQRMPDGKEDAIDTTHFSGNWANLRLGLTSTVTGYVYVLTTLEHGKWELMSPESQTILRTSDGAIAVKPYQPVTFALSQITNELGRPVVSSVTVLLSSNLILDLGKWLGEERKQDQVKDRIHQLGDQGFLAMEQHQKPETPFRVDISLRPLVH